MRRSFPLMKHSLLPHLLRRPPPPPPLRRLSSLPSLPASPPPSRILQPPPPPPAADADADADADSPDEAMNEFLSRFAWAVRGKLTAAFPDLPRATLNAMLLIVCQNVVDAMDNPGAVPAADTEFTLSPDLWTTIWEVSNAVHEDMRRDRKRAELKKYLHCDDVKEMCRFAGDVGIRGSFLRELRVKWAREKMEEVDFYKNIERMREEGKQIDEATEQTEAGNVVEGEGKVALMRLPERRGKIRYTIYGLDLSAPEWAVVAEKTEAAEKKFVPEEAQAIVGRCKKVDDRILALDAEKDDLVPVLEEWKEILQPKRADWLALLNRIKERNVDLYYKISDLLLSEGTFEANVRDYSKLIGAYSKAGRIGDAEILLQRMTEREIMPDVLTSNILVHMYSKAGNIDRAKAEFENLRKHGFKPDLKTYSSMITAYVNAGLPTQGETVIREMETKGIKPTKEIYMELLRAFSERGQVDSAQRIVNTMPFAGIQPTLESCTLLVESYARAGDTDQAQGNFDHMISCGNRPDDRCTASMIGAYMNKNYLDKALDLLSTLEKDGFQPGIATYSVLLDWMGRLQLVDEAERLLSAIREKGEAPFEVNVSLCFMYAKAREEVKARKYLTVLEGRKELLRADQFERIVEGLVEGGFTEDAKRIYDMMQARGFSPSEKLRVQVMAAQTIPRQNQFIRRGYM